MIAEGLDLTAKFSVLLPVYCKDSPEHLAECLRSIERQTRTADEILIVKDGPLGKNLEGVIATYSARLPIVSVQLPKNEGVGEALRIGVESCRFDIIARMDADDICVAERFERELYFLALHPEVDAVSSAIQEFDIDPSVCVSERRLPSEHAAIMAFAKQRCPLNGMAVVFRRAAVLAAGNYRKWNVGEDYDLWVRMHLNGSILHNLQDVLIFARRGNGMQKRRGGWGYLKREASLFWNFRSLGFLTTFESLHNIGLRVLVRLLPSAARAFLYELLVRSPAGQ
jgi:glycosyltransferase involved in cell wall biosynthesis